MKKLFLVFFEISRTAALQMQRFAAASAFDNAGCLTVLKKNAKIVYFSAKQQMCLYI